MSKVIFKKSTMEQVLVDLWNSTKAFGLGALHSHQQPSVEQAKQQLNRSKYVDYFFGKPIKTDFSDFPELDSWGYDRDAGEGTMQKVADGSAQNIGSTKELNEQEVDKLLDWANQNMKVTSYKSMDNK